MAGIVKMKKHYFNFKSSLTPFEVREMVFKLIKSGYGNIKVNRFNNGEHSISANKPKTNRIRVIN